MPVPRGLWHDELMMGGLRVIRRNPAVAFAAMATVALGIGANTAVFSVIEAVLLTPLPFSEPSRIVMIWETHPELSRLQVAAPDFEDWKTSASSFESIAAYSMQVGTKVTVIGSGAPFQAQATTASWNLFDLLGVKPIAGRTISRAEDQGGQKVLLISERLWRNQFAADRAAIGRSIRIGPDTWTIAGVMPSDAAFPAWAEVWLPFSYLDSGTVNQRRFHPLEVVARLKPGVTEAQAQGEMTAIAARLSRDYPATNKTIGAAVISLDAQTTGEVRPVLIALLGAVGLILLIACANVAHLLLARALAHSREAAIRAALGANWLRLARHSVGESLTLAMFGGAAGLWIASFALPILSRLAQGRIPRIEAAHLDTRVFAFSFALVILSGILAGLLPALRAAAVDLNDALKSGGAVVRAGRAGAFLVTAEVALAVTILSGAGLLLRSYANVLSGDPGFNAEHVLTAELSLPFPPAQATQVFRDEILPKLRDIPGVQTAALVNMTPATIGTTERSRWATRFGIPGHAYEPGKFPVAQARFMSPQYLDAIGIHLRSGRALTAADENQPVLLINETFARTYFPGQNPVGKSILLGVMLPTPNEIRIAGVVEDAPELGLEMTAPATLYTIGYGQGTLLLRSAADPGQLTGSLRAAVAAVNPEFALGRVRTMTEIVSDSLARRKFALLLMTLFAAVGAALAAVGIYGVVSYSVASRVREMGLRMALGAQRGQLLRMVLRESGLRTLAGLAIGLAGAFASSRLLANLLYGTSPHDPVALFSACAALGLISLAAAWIPARRATRVDPMIALREQ